GSRRTARLINSETYRKTGKATMRDDTDQRTAVYENSPAQPDAAGSGNARLMNWNRRLPKLYALMYSVLKSTRYLNASRAERYGFGLGTGIGISTSANSASAPITWPGSHLACPRASSICFRESPRPRASLTKPSNSSLMAITSLLGAQSFAVRYCLT